MYRWWTRWWRRRWPPRRARAALGARARRRYVYVCSFVLCIYVCPSHPSVHQPRTPHVLKPKLIQAPCSLAHFTPEEARTLYTAVASLGRWIEKVMDGRVWLDSVIPVVVGWGFVCDPSTWLCCVKSYHSLHPTPTHQTNTT